jgi:diguanylate cyclase (GGDEF)-like protein
VGDENIEPALIETIVSGGRTLGKILIGSRQRAPFSPAEVEKLRHYSRLIAHLLDAAEQQQHWQSLAMIDEVTGLPNRRYLLQALESILARADVERFRVTILLFDLDGFKHFNDNYGHATGDQILRETGQLFRRHCRQHDIVARYAGDEFVVVFWDAEGPRIAGSKHPTDALAVLRRCKESLESHEFPRLGPGAKGRITISGGLASFPWDARDTRSLIDKADQAMLEAKRAGKNRVYLVGAEGESAHAVEPLDETSEE